MAFNRRATTRTNFSKVKNFITAAIEVMLILTPLHIFGRECNEKNYTQNDQKMKVSFQFLDGNPNRDTPKNICFMKEFITRSAVIVNGIRSMVGERFQGTGIEIYGRKAEYFENLDKYPVSGFIEKYVQFDINNTHRDNRFIIMCDCQY